MKASFARNALLAIALACSALAAPAAERNPGIQASTTGKTNAGTVGTSSAELIAAATNPAGRIYVSVVNQGAATIACRFGGTAAVAGAGSYDIPAGWTRSWNGPFVPSDALNCISSSGTINVTWAAY